MGWWGQAPHMEENSWGGPAPHSQPMSGVFRVETLRERIVTSSWRLVGTSSSYTLTAGQDEWVGNSFSSLLAPTASSADVTLRLCH